MLKKRAKKKTAAKIRKATVKRSSGKKTAKKKTMKKKTTVKKAAKKILKRTVKRKNASKAGPARKKPLSKRPLLVKPGPPAGTVPPVEEAASNEDAIGVITHYYSHLGVAVAQLNTGMLKIGDRIHVKGHTTDFMQTVESMEYEHQHIDQAGAGQNIGLKVIDHAREHDIVYRIK